MEDQSKGEREKRERIQEREFMNGK